MVGNIKDYLHSAQLLCIRQDLTGISFQQFWQDVAMQCHEIKKLKPMTYALWQHSSYEFLVLLFAALHAGKTVILPPHRVAELEQDLAKQQIYFLNRQALSQSDASIEQQLHFDEHFYTETRLYFYTSGSTGQPKSIARTLKQLLSEVQGLELSFGLSKAAIALATVSHQHIYGLLFKLLWPLATHRSFYDQHIAFPEEVSEIQKKLVIFNQPNYLISSPALLKRWTTDVILNHCIAVYSSGGKLDAGIRPYINVMITEVFGSSETGGIAYRYHDDALWHVFEDVEIKVVAAQELAVKTAHASSDEWILTADQVELSHPHDLKSDFRLLGRLDRIVKLEEKRLSLDAIEQQILSLGIVEQVYVLIIEKQHRQMLAAIVILNHQGREQLQHLGKAQFVHRLKTQLSLKLESIALPRQWRFLTQLPQNSQSKLDKQYMQSIFEENRYPVVLSQFIEEKDISYILEFIEELACFKGHFPGQPIYPGVGQIGLVQHFAKKNWLDLAWCNGYEQVKFQDLIQPKMVLCLNLQRQAHKIIFELKNQDKVFASGRLLFNLNPIQQDG
ncbi:AMP-binding protein [Acinetobacter sp. SAAs470]|nr:MULTISPECIES: AMP-binding protein [unclassified Acinetobacter]WOE33183.1 AMP-binding protein [Acinetobacter sp. SAAs470]WOE39844.1 AMP-binding protein [Acinetobacter sp. SAAs474]